jgi:DNA-binding beta-propeller fold protein YncE
MRPQHSSRSVRTLVLVAMVTGAGAAQAEEDFPVFESGHVRPLALSPSKNYLYAVNTPDNRLEVFRVVPNGLVAVGSVQVGLEPVAVAARNADQVWVVNHLSDSVSIVDVRDPARPVVSRTLSVADEPRDVVFAGPDKRRAFITTAHRGQNAPYDPQVTTPGIGRADVWVYDADHVGQGLGGQPLTIINLFTDTPRALAVSPNGRTVYAAGFHTGNQTSVATEFLSRFFGDLPLPPPLENAFGSAQPATGLIIKWNGAHWVDPAGRIRDNAAPFTLPDRDVFVIDAMANPPRMAPGPSNVYSGVGTILFNMAVNPVNGKVYVSNTEALNHVRFEGPGVHGGSTVRGHHNESRISVLGGGHVQPRHLNKHNDYSTCCAELPNTENALAMALPLQMEVTANGATLYLAAMGSSKIGVYSTAQLEQDTFYPNTLDQIPVSGGGPTGLALDEGRNQLYVLTRFDNAISVVRTDIRMQVAHVAMHNPEPAKVVTGRRFLYDATLSSKGDSFCGSCHVFGDLDNLGWDLGNPDDEDLPDLNPLRADVSAGPVPRRFASMKGPMTTQSLRGLDNHGPQHWRGDRTGSYTEPNVQPDSGAFNEREAFRQFQVAFPGLVGMPAQLPEADMEAFIDFAMALMYPPNPLRNLDNSLTPQQAQGRDIFFNRVTTAGALPCQSCHQLDPTGNAEFGVKRPGFFGTDGSQALEIFEQTFKIPHFRNLYTKVGKFGSPDLDPFFLAFEPAEPSNMGEQIRGFGFSRAGDVDTLFRFMHAFVFTTAFPGNTDGIEVGAAGDPDRRAAESFLLAFDSNLKPVVGQQVTLWKNGGSTASARADLLVARAAAGDCDLVAKGSLGGRERGYLYSGGAFLTDESASPPVSDGALRAQFLAGNASLTYTCTPPGSGRRIGIDRDGDGLLDGDE